VYSTSYFDNKPVLFKTTTTTKMGITVPKTSVLLSLAVLIMRNLVATEALRINEVADKVTATDTCNGEDWIELYNPGEEAVNLSSYGLFDDKGYDDEDRFSFPDGTFIQPKSYLLLCTDQENDPLSPQFGLKDDDTVTLYYSMNDTGPFVILSFVELQGGSSTNSVIDGDVTYAFDEETGTWIYTSTPTPGEQNIITELVTTEQWKSELEAQNALGTAFFNMDGQGLPVKNGFDTVLELHIEMAAEDYDYMMENTRHELNRPFQSLRLTTTSGEELASTNTSGKIRPKGQSSLFIAICVRTKAFPFQVELAENDSLFGVGRFYLRNHIADFSYTRDYAYNRMLARFGLPHMRARKVRVHINGNTHGYYTLVEAPDQDYVFHRSFPDFDPQRYALFKVKSFGIDCGSYSPEQIAAAEARVNETSTPPYAFERGEHKKPVPEYGFLGVGGCSDAYDFNTWERDYDDTAVAWLRNDRSCEDMLLNTGLIDRDLGTNAFESEIREFITQDFSYEKVCDVGCKNSDLADRVDQENWLKSLAFYAVTMNSDSPLVNGNNYYIAQSGSEKNGGVGGWKIVPYDFNVAEVYDCYDELCNDRLVHWSIARPTCTSLEANDLVGPLLLNSTLHSQYLEYVEQFVETV
jgi:hypothetical protein